jgi:hypothetical protein
MAAHVADQLQDAVIAALTGLTTTGARVFDEFDLPLARTDLPALNIRPVSDKVEAASLPAPRLLVCRLELEVTALVRSNASTRATLNQIRKEVAIALAMPCPAVPMAKTIALSAVDYVLDGSGERPIGQAAMTYELTYYVAENTPDVAL